MYCLSSSSSPSIRTSDQLHAETLAGKAHIAKLNELAELEGSELTSTTVDDTALNLLKRQGSPAITIVSLQRKFIFDS